MKIIWLFLFVGIIQCDDQSISPAQYGSLGVPNTIEYISVYTLSVQTSYITSVECMLSSNFYIKSGFSEIDSRTNDIVSNLAMIFENGMKGLDDMFTDMESDLETEMKNKLDSVLFMTSKYYLKQNITVDESDLGLGSATEVTCAKSKLTAQRCQSSYTSFMSEIDTLKSKYTSESSSTSSKSESAWTSIVQNYYEARTEIDRKTYVYASIRDAFMYGSGIDLCQGSTNKDQQLLDIYKSDDLSSFFGISDQTDASELFEKTVNHMYSIYKTSLSVIYINSVAKSDNDLALRILAWEQINSVRANFEYKSQMILTFIKGIQDNAESKLQKDSNDYNQAMTVLYKTIHKLLITMVKTTEVHYQRAWNFDSQDSVMQTNYNSYSIDVLIKYYQSILWKNANVANFDMRLADNSSSSNAPTDMAIPKNMYSMVVNKLVFQTFLCDLNYVLIRIQTSLNDQTDASTWSYNEQITLKEMQCSIIFAKCSAVSNKIYCMNAATYAYVIQQTSSSTTSTSTTSIQTTDVTQIMSQICTDVIGTLSVNTKEITASFHEVEIHINKNSKTNASSINYQPGFRSFTGNSPSPPSSTSPPSSPSTNTPMSPPTSPPSSPSTEIPMSPPTIPPSSPSTNTPISPSTSPPSSPSTEIPMSPPTGPPSSPSTNSPISPSTSPPSSPSTEIPMSPPTGPPSSPSTNSPISPSTSPPSSLSTEIPMSPPTIPPSSPSPNTPISPSTSPPSAPSTEIPMSPPTIPPSSPSTNTPMSPPTSDTSSYTTPSTPTDTDSGVYSRSSGSSTYVSITSNTQILQSIEYFSTSVIDQFSSSISTIQSTQESEYTKTVTSSLQSCQEQFQYNIDYLNTVVIKSEEFISQQTESGSDDYSMALTTIFKDIEEKKAILSSFLEVSFRRANDYSLESTEYINVQQTVTYTEYVKQFYSFFNMDYSEVYNSDNDADAYISNSEIKFLEIHEMVVTAVQATSDDSYKEYLLWKLDVTAKVFKQTTDSFKTYISQSQMFISQSSSSQSAFYTEIKQRMETILAIYSATLIKSYQYAQKSTTVTIYESEYEVVVTQTSITKTVTEESSSTSSSTAVQATSLQSELATQSSSSSSPSSNGFENENTVEVKAVKVTVSGD